MSDLDDIVDVQIDLQVASVTEAGFGTPLIVSSEAFVDDKFIETAKVYGALDELGPNGDNYDTNGVTYKKALAIFSQNPRVGQIVIGKRSNLPLMTMDMTPIAKNSTDYTITINGEDLTFTSDADATVPEIITGLVGVINGGTQNVLATDQGPGTFLRIEAADSPGGAATAGIPYTIEYERSLFSSQNTTPDPGIAADIDLIRTNLDGNDDWYLGLLDSYGEAEILAMAGAIEAIDKIYIATTSDADVLTSAIDDVGSTLRDLSRVRTSLIWHENPHTGPDAAWAGACLPTDPGSITWAFKTLSGISPSVLSTSEIANIDSKAVNRYVTKAGTNATYFGYVSDAVTYKYIDIVRGLDFVKARLQEKIFGQLKAAPKIPYTNAGIAIIETAVREVMSLAVSQGVFSSDTPPVVSVPDVSEVQTNDKANRILTDVKFNAVLAGAIHKVEIRGTVTV